MVQMEHNVPDNNPMKYIMMSYTCLCQTLSSYNIFSVLQGYLPVADWGNSCQNHKQINIWS